MNMLRSIVLVLCVAVLTLPLLALQAVALRLAPGLSRRIPIWVNRMLLVALGVRLHVRGRERGESLDLDEGSGEHLRHGNRPDLPRRLRGEPGGVATILVANHVSWLDIPVLGAIAPVRFVSKSEVASWPVIGWCARLMRTVFIERGSHGTVAAKASEVAAALKAGDEVVIFPEGTTSDGNRVLFFKSGLLGAVREAMGDAPLQVRPLTIVHTHASGLPLGRAHRNHAAYPGGVSLGDSLIRVLREGALDVAVDWHEPISYPRGEPRKVFAARLERIVRGHFSARIADGRIPPRRLVGRSNSWAAPGTRA